MRRDHEALRYDQVRDEARTIPSLLGPSLGRGRGDDASSATARDDLTENDEAPKIAGHADVALARLGSADAAERGSIEDGALLERLGDGLELLLGDDVIGAQKRLLEPAIGRLRGRAWRPPEPRYLADLLRTLGEGSVEHLDLRLEDGDLGPEMVGVVAPLATVLLVAVVGRNRQTALITMRAECRFPGRAFSRAPAPIVARAGRRAGRCRRAASASDAGSSTTLRGRRGHVRHEELPALEAFVTEDESARADEENFHAVTWTPKEDEKTKSVTSPS